MSLTRRHATRLLLSAAAGAALPVVPSGSRFSRPRPRRRSAAAH